MNWMHSIAAAALLGFFQHSWGFTYELAEGELQQKVSAAMPIEIKKPYYTLLISDPVIDLTRVDGIGILFHADLTTINSEKVNGSIGITGQLVYERQSSSFFLKSVRVRQVSVEGLDDKLIPGVMLMTQLAVSKALAIQPVYVIKDGSLKAAFAKSYLKSTAIRDGKLILTLEIF